MPTPTLGEALEAAVEALGGHRDEARADAELLMAEATGRPRHHAFAWADARPSQSQYTRYLDLVERRRRGEPVAEDDSDELKGAPRKMPVRRLDDVKAARQLDLAWDPEAA